MELTSQSPRWWHLWSVLAWLAMSGWAGEPAPVEIAWQQSAEAYVALAAEVTTAAAAAAEQLALAATAWAAQPSPERLGQARAAWWEARRAYLLTEPLRFSGGPIDDDDGPEQAINAWPLQRSAVAEQHTFSVAAHLLWQVTEQPQSLRLATAALAKDLTSVAAEWRPGELGNFRTIFLEERSMRVQRMLTGLALMADAELATTRLQLPLDAADEALTTAPAAGKSAAEAGVTVAALARFWQPLEKYVQVINATAARQISAHLKQAATWVAQLPEHFYEADPNHVTQKLIIVLEDLAAAWRGVGATLDLHIPLEVGPEGE